MSEPPHSQGPLRFLRLLGAGASAEVWLVETTEAVADLAAGARVAAKVPAAGDRAAAARLRHEGRLGRRVRHPALVAVHGLVELDGDRSALLLEAAEGATLRERLAELGCIPEALARPIALALAEALAALHAEGVVHRDVKPENVALTESHEVKLLDLGLALDERGGAGEQADFVGTREYAAPELLSSGRADAASDRYALGALLHEIVSGVAPRTRREGGAPPLGALAPRVSDWFEELVDVLLSAEPEDRFGSSDELVEVLRDAEVSRWWTERRRGAETLGRRSWWPDRSDRSFAHVGRETELAALEAAFAEAESGRGAFILLEGEAGLGKSRLAVELVARLEAGGQAFLGLHGDASQVSRRGPLALALHRRFGAAGLHRTLAALDGAPAEQRAAVADFVLGRSGTSGDPGAFGLVVEGLGRLLESLSSRGTVLWIVEDLHSLEAEERARLERLARVALRGCVLLLATSRPLGEGAPDGALRIPLGPLTSEESRSLLDALAVTPEDAQRLAANEAAIASGHPLLLRELADGRGDQTDASLGELVLARVAALPARQAELLYLAASDGEMIEARLLSDARGWPLLEVLDTLSRIELGSRLVSSSGAGHRFSHPAYRELLAGARDEAARAEDHVCLAEAWARRIDRDSDPDESAGARAAAHFLAAGRLEEARPYLDEGLRRWDERCEHGVLLEATQSALRLLGDSDPSLRCELLARRASALALLGRREDRMNAAQDALQAALDSGDEALVRARKRELAAAWLERSEFDKVRALAEEVAASSLAAGDLELEEKAASLLGRVHDRQGRFAEARREHERSLRLARERGDSRAEVMAQAFLGGLHYRSGQLAEARACAEAQLAVWRALGDRFREAHAWEALGAALNALGERQEAIVAHERAVDLFEMVGFSVGVAGATLSLCNDLLQLGRWASAREQVDRALHLARELGRRDLECGLLINGGVACLEMGLLSEAEEDLRAALELADTHGWRPWAAYALETLGRVAQWRGSLDESALHHEHAVAMQRGLGVEADVGRALTGLGLVEWRRGQEARAIELLEEAARLVPAAHVEFDGPTPQVALAACGRGDARQVQVPRGLPARVRAECWWLLHEAGAGSRALSRAWNLVDALGRQLPDELREGYWRHNAVARSVRAAIDQRLAR